MYYGYLHNILHLNKGEEESMLGRNVYKEIGKRIKQSRESLGMNQTMMADKVGISASYACHLEAGNRNMSLDTLIKISNALNISLEYLIFGNKPNNKAVSSVMEDKLLKDLKKLFKSEKGEQLRKVVQILVDNYKEL